MVLSENNIKLCKMDRIKDASVSELEKILKNLISEIEYPSESTESKVQEHLDRVQKAPVSLGDLGEIAKKVAGIQHKEHPQISKKTLLIMAGDHDVVKEKVSSSPQENTRIIFNNYVDQTAGLNVLAKQCGTQVISSDIGIIPSERQTEISNYHIKNGSGNIKTGPAMTHHETLAALICGAQIAIRAISEGSDILGIGEVGIGNTTPSAALIAVFTGRSVEQITDSGSTPSTSLLHKQMVIKEAIEVNKPNSQNPVETLEKIGGLEIAAITGAILAASSCKVPAVIDGLISVAAALTAVQICSASAHYLIASQSSKEYGHKIALNQMKLKPYLDFNMDMGEGTAAVLMISIIELAVAACTK